jgi:hypothetical protein
MSVYEKLGNEFDISIKDAIEQISGYEVKSGDTYKKVLDEKLIPYTGVMYNFHIKEKTLSFTPWHICEVILDDGNEVTLYASDVQKGMSFKVDGIPEKITNISESNFEGYVYGFEVEGIQNGYRFKKANILKNIYDDGSTEYVLDTTGGLENN